ncbi:hypothetical protein M3147_08445 [Agromyces mediolanus]|uniref:hypothetical protein n=1 Tax=Agromyces mediolanus TaxID=41986 RepID=UPI002040F155|nr:hypothetical protein [Agromyces mediolanus]MCM3657278.1 hypothetical protein [Agromyces mediolanus]
MIVRSLRWSPFLAYTYLGGVIAGTSVLAVIIVEAVRNPVMLFWAIFVGAAYFCVLLSVLMLVGSIMIACRRLASIDRMSSLWLAVVGGLLGGPVVALAIWWPITFQFPPIWFLSLITLIVGIAYWRYVAVYERAQQSHSETGS